MSTTTSQSSRNDKSLKPTMEVPAMDGAMKSMIEDMVKKLVVEMMSGKAASSEEELPPVKPTLRKIPNGLNVVKEEGRVSIVDHGRISAISELTISDPTDIMDEKISGSISSKPGTDTFYQDMTTRLRPHRKGLCINHESKKALYKYDDSEGGRRASIAVCQVPDFIAAFEPDDMRCLALVSHNEMKATMKDFVIKYKNVLSKFRLTGTASTMKMLGQVFEGDDSVIFGPACSSGPLGGDAELVAMMSTGQLGGILFFQDPMTSHPHQCDIDCLVRQALVHNTIMASTPTTAMAIMEVFKMALVEEGRPEIIPSFFFTLQSPTVAAYKNNQNQAIESHRT